MSIARQPAGVGRPTRLLPGAGLTLLELLMALAISAVLTVISVQPAREFLAARQTAPVVASLRSALWLARSEALKRGEQVSVCPLDPAAGEAAAVCLHGLDWSAGWLVFVDRGERGVLEQGDVLLQAEVALAHAPQITSTMRVYSFQPTGISLNAASHIDVLPEGVPRDRLDRPGVRRVCVNKPGRTRVLPGGEPCAS